MRIIYDRNAVYDAVRDTVFRGRLYQGQIDGIDQLLREWEDAYPTGDTRFIAYILATPAWETARTMQPIKEHGDTAYFTRMYDIRGARPAVARELGNIEPGDGARFCGRGLAQTTGRRNYAWASTVIGQDCVANPDLLLQPEWACKVIFAAMIGGRYTGKKLADYFNGVHTDWINARRIINGLDQASTIAAFAEHFYAGLKAGMTKSDDAQGSEKIAAPAPAPPAAISPPKAPAPSRTITAPATPAPAPAPTLISRIAGIFGLGA